MKIGIYAGSLRPGGGVSVLRQMISALADGQDNQITVYIGAADAEKHIQNLVSGYTNVRVIRFLAHAPAGFRYVCSKLFFLRRSKSSDFDWLVSFNYFIPCRCRLMVYHINLLSFMPAEHDSISMRMKRLDARIACRFADANIFESRYLADVAEDSCGSTINSPGVLYVGVNEDFFGDSDTENEVPRSSVDVGILLVSSMQRHKDNDTVLRMLSELVKHRPEVPWTLSVVGGQDIRQWDSLLARASELQVADRVKLLGHVDRRRLSNMMANSLCLVSASRIESFGMVALEAMASGCPAIVTNSTSMPESVGDSAVIVDPGDESQFANAVLKFYDDPEFRLHYIEMGKEWARRFSIENFKSQLNSRLKVTHDSVLGDNR